MSHRRTAEEQLPTGLIEAVRKALPEFRGRRTMSQLVEVLQMQAPVSATGATLSQITIAVKRVLSTASFAPADYLDERSLGRHRRQATATK